MYAKEKVEKQKKVKILSFIICKTPKIFSAFLGDFLTIFTLFHLKLLQLCKISQSSISGTP